MLVRISPRLPLLALVALALFSRPAAAATLNVPSQYATIQAAVNASANGDTVLIADGTYTGPGNVDVDFNGKNITVTSQHGAASTIINCGGSSTSYHRGFYLHSGETNAVISGLTIQNGYEYNPGAVSSGGGIYSFAGLTVQGCILKNNTAGSGGGIYNSIGRYGAGGTATIIDCVFVGNSALFTGNNGGGLYNSIYPAGTIAVTNCTFTGNSAAVSATAPPGGGGIYDAGETYPPGSSTITLTNDILYGDTGGEVGGTGATAAYCDIQGGFAGTGNLNADPLFVNAPTDLHLQAASPCLGMGTVSGAPATTIDGQTRPTPPSIGAYEIVPAAPPSLINDTDSGLVYSGSGWFYSPNRGVGDVSNDVHATANNGDSVSYRFTGSSISYIAETCFDEGTVDVYVDGVFQQTVNCHTASRLAKQTVYSLAGLPQGAHTLKLVKTGGGYMVLDALLATPAVSGSSLINDTSYGIAYTGGWFYSPGRGVGDLNDDVHATAFNGDSFSYTFTGTGIGYLAETDFDEGNVQVFLDGTPQAVVNAFSPTRQARQMLWSKTGLSDTSHTLTVVKQDGQYMLLDGLLVTPALPTVTVVNDTDGGFAYSGASWFYSPNRGAGDFGDDVHAATVNGDSVSYSFIGTGVSYLAETNTDEGTVDVYLDGVFAQTVNCNTPSRLVQQSVYTVSGLTAGSHTLKLVKTGGAYMVLDAVAFE